MTAPDADDLRAGLEEIVGAEALTPATALPGLAVDGLVPRYAATPADRGTAARALRWAADAGLAIVPRGGGHHLGIGNPPRALDLVLQTRRLDRVVAYIPAEGVITVEAGVRLQDLAPRLAAHGQWLPLDPDGWDEGATIGGVLAADVSGPLRHRYGTARSLLLGTVVAHPDGRITRAGGRVVKNVAGYEAHRLWTGSLGTLVLILEASFRLHTRPQVMTPWRATLRDGTEAAAAALTVRREVPDLAWLEVGRSPEEGAWTLDTAACGFAEEAAWQGERLTALVGAKEGPAGHRPAPTRGAIVVRTSTPVPRLGDLLAAVPPGTAVTASAGAGVSRIAWPRAEGGSAEAVAALRAEVLRLGGTAVIETGPPDLKRRVDAWGPPREDHVLMQAVKARLDPRGVMSPGRYVGGI